MLALALLALALWSTTGNAQAGAMALALPPILALLGKVRRGEIRTREVRAGAVRTGGLRSWRSDRALRAFSFVVLLSGLLFLWQNGSRGGLLAASAGLLVYWIGAARRPGRALAIAAAALTGGGWLAWHLRVRGEPLWTRMMLEAQAEGFSLSAVTTGRLEIWQRGLWMVEDAWPFGLGPGGFAHALASYPFSTSRPVPIDHAHSGALQIAVELGPVGMLLALSLLLRSASMLIRTWKVTEASQRGFMAGVGGGLVAFLVFQIGDVSTGFAGLLPWLLLAFIHRGMDGQPSPRRLGRVSAGLAAGLAAALALMSLILGAWPLWRQPPAHRLLSFSELPVADPPSELHWLESVRAGRAGRLDEQDRAWRRLLAASPRRLALLSVASSDLALAEEAASRWPNSAQAWRFKAMASVDENTAIEAWRKVLELAPSDGDAWLELADLLVASDIDEALESYAKACVHGDPGANACLRGGRLAQRHGADIRAKALYRRSRWPPVRALADPPSLNE